MNKTIITAALTGAITPPGYKIPETPEAIAQTAYECWKLGAAVVHLHMRDEKGWGVMDPERFRETIKLIRSHKDCDVIINCTSSGDHRVSDDSEYGNARRMEHHCTVPGIEMGSFDCGSFNWGVPGGVFNNSQKFLTDLGHAYKEHGVTPEIEIFDAGMMGAVPFYVKNGALTPPLHFQFCLGIVGGMGATPEELQYLISRLPAGSTWSAFGTGKGHMPIMYATLANGGNIRVGMEDNVVYGIDENGQKIMATNQMLVERAVRAVETFGNKVATSAEAREMLGLAPLDAEKVRKELGIE